MKRVVGNAIRVDVPTLLLQDLHSLDEKDVRGLFLDDGGDGEDLQEVSTSDPGLSTFPFYEVCVCLEALVSSAF